MNVKELLEQYAAGVRDFKGIELSEAKLSGANLRRVNFSYIIIPTLVKKLSIPLIILTVMNPLQQQQN